MTGPIEMRAATAADAALLWNCLAFASYERDAASAKAIPAIAKYLDGWPRAGDFGVVAERDELALGAAWARQFRGDEKPWVYVDDRTPELSIGVLPEWRGSGVGAALLEGLIAVATERGCRGMCLNVRMGNPALRLYERSGFRRVPGGEIVNRVGGRSFGLCLQLSGEPPE